MSLGRQSDFGATEYTDDHEDTIDDQEKQEKELYINVMEDLKQLGNEQASQVIGELLEKLEDVTKNEKQLREKMSNLVGVINDLTLQQDDNQYALNRVMTSMRASGEENEQLKLRIDMSQMREQNHQEVIETLRNQTEFLESEVERVKQEQDDLAKEIGIHGKTKEAFLEDRKKLKSENASLKENMTSLSEEMDVVTKKLDQTKSSLLITQHQFDNLKLLNEELHREKGYMSKEASLQRSLVHQLKKNLILLKTHHDSLKTKLNKAEANLNSQKKQLFTIESTNKGLKSKINNNEKEITNLNRKLYHLNEDKRNANQISQAKDKEMLVWKKKVNEAERKEQGVMKAYRKLHGKAARALSTEKPNIEKTRQPSVNDMGVNEELKDLKEELAKVKKHYFVLSDHLHKTTNLSAEYLKKYEVESSVRKSLQVERDKLKYDMYKFFMTNLNLYNERDRCLAGKKLMEMKVEEQLLYIRHKEIVIADIKKELEEKKASMWKQENMYKDLKGERNVIANLLAKAQDTNKEMKRNYRTLSKQLDQLTEIMIIKDNQVIQVERVNKRKVNETVRLKWLLNKNRNQMKTCKDSTHKLEKEQIQINRTLEKNNKDQNIVKKNLNRALNDKAILLTQLDRKTAELNCLQDNFNFMEIILKKGDTQYNQRLDDIRILRLEILKLRREKSLTMKALDNNADLRKEVYHLYTELNMERNKCSALEQEIQTPVNFHRWRFLQGTDPERKDLINKVNILQKSLIRIRAETSRKDFEIDQLRCIHDEFRSKVERMPGQEIFQTMVDLKTQLNNREEEIKIFSSLLACSEHEIKKLRLNNDICSQSTEEFKKKYYDLKLTYDKEKQRWVEKMGGQVLCQVSLARQASNSNNMMGDASAFASCILVQTIPCT